MVKFCRQGTQVQIMSEREGVSKVDQSNQIDRQTQIDTDQERERTHEFVGKENEDMLTGN